MIGSIKVSHWRPLIFAGLFLSGCGINSPKYQLSDGRYRFRQQNEKYADADLFLKDDSAHVFLVTNPTVAVRRNPLSTQYFLKRSFDLDVITVPFKFRPSASGLPRQLNTDFNGNVFAGYRLDRFRIMHARTPVGIKEFSRHCAISVGAFGGIGSATVSPSTTKNFLADEYNGFVISRGGAVMIGINNLTVGVGVGWDALTDRDRKVWIYQNRPWYGLTLGLNLN